jgi:hypothetical protein
VKSLFQCIILVLATAAQAEELQFDLTGSELTPDNNHSVGPIDISFVLDTLSGTSSSFTFGNFRTPGGAPCLQHFGVSGASLSNVNVTLNGQSVLFARSSTASYAGDNGSGGCPGFFFAALVVPGAFGWIFDPGPWMSQTAFLGSADPVARLFLGFQGFPSTGTFDGLNLDITHVTVTPVSVPEPGTFGLLMLGFAGVVLCGRKRISVRAPALSASVIDFGGHGLLAGRPDWATESAA